MRIWYTKAKGAPVKARKGQYMFHFSSVFAKVKSLSRSTLLILGVAITSLTLAVTSIGVGFGIQNSRAAVEDHYPNNRTNYLFRHDGVGHGATLARQLLDLAEATIPSKTFLGSPVRVATMRDISAANEGDRVAPVPRIRVFQDFDEYPGTPGFAQSHSRIAYTLCAITYSDNGKPFFTFTGTNHLDKYNEDKVGGIYTSDYNAGAPNYRGALSVGCSARNKNTNGMENEMLPLFPSDVRRAFVSPNQMPHNWNMNQPTNVILDQQSTILNQSLTGARLDDLVWMPSWYEWHEIFEVSLAERFDDRFYWVRGEFVNNGNPSHAVLFNPKRDTWGIGHVYSDNYASLLSFNISGEVLEEFAAAKSSNNGDDGDGGSDGVDPSDPVGPNNPIVPDYKEQSQKGLSAGALGGIIGGCLVAVGGATCGVIYYVSRRRKNV